jgi:hypothetical protein
MTAPDDLDPARLTRLRSLLVEQARADSVAAPARHRRRRLLAAVGGFAAVGAVAAVAVAVVVAGVPVVSGQPAASGSATVTPTVSPTVSPTPSPSPPPTAPATTAPPSATPPSATPPATSPPAPLPGGDPLTVEQFQAAVTAAGFDCSTWQPLTGDSVPGLVEAGQCLPAGFSFQSYETETDLQRVLQLNEDSLETQRFLVGTRWIVGVDDVDGDSDDLLVLREQLGGIPTWDTALPS